MAKVIARDNYDRDTVNERLIAAGLSDETANVVVTELNTRGETGDWFYVVVADDYKLYEWRP